MKIDRTQFLFLTGAISAGVLAACSSSNQTTEVAVPDGGPVVMLPATASDASSAFDSSTSEGGDDDSSTTTDAAVDSSTCDDSVAPANSVCTTLESDGGAASDAGGSCVQPVTCGTFEVNAKKAVAANIATCISGLSDCESGDGVNACYSTALEGACPDTAAADLCAMTIASCSGDGGVDAGATALTDCESVLNGLTDTGRGTYISCVLESISGCPTSFVDYACLAQLFPLAN